MIHYRNPRLFAPGPTPVPEAVRIAMAKPQMHHRSAAFRDILARVRASLCRTFGTKQDVLLLGGTGTLGMEAAVTNTLSPGDTAIFVNGGRFGRRWGDLLHAFGVHGVEIAVAPGHAVEPAQLAEALQSYPDARAVLVQSCETSTGVRHPVEQLAALTADKERTIFVCDAITEAGLRCVEMDQHGFDVVIGASQKGFMMPPGLTFVALSSKAWRLVDDARLPRFYADLGREWAMADQGNTSWTTPTSLVLGLDAALELLEAEGYAQRERRHVQLGSACRAGIEALGCQLFARAPSLGLTALTPPAPLTSTDIIRHLKETHGITVGGGMDQLAGRLVRVGHMGHVDGQDMLGLLAALGETLVALGHSVEPTAGVGAAQRVLWAAH